MLAEVLSIGTSQPFPAKLEGDLVTAGIGSLATAVCAPVAVAGAGVALELVEHKIIFAPGVSRRTVTGATASQPKR